MHLNDDFCKRIIFASPTEQGFEPITRLRPPKKPVHDKIIALDFKKVFPQRFRNPPTAIAPGPIQYVGIVPRNRAGQRIDPATTSTQLERKMLQDKQAGRLCNEFHLHGPEHCKYGNRCKFKHDIINDEVRRVLQDLARYTHCKMGTVCSYIGCYAGHKCPYEPCRGDCGFPKEMHFTDRVIVNEQPLFRYAPFTSLQTTNTYQQSPYPPNPASQTIETNMQSPFGYHCVSRTPVHGPLPSHDSHFLFSNTTAMVSEMAGKTKEHSPGIIGRPSRLLVKLLPAITTVITDT